MMDEAGLKRRGQRYDEPHPAAGAEHSPLIVGIGASAGGLAAFKSFFSTMPADTGMTFVLVQHLAPDHQSMLVELLTPHIGMPVLEARDGLKMAENHVYVIPPNATLTFVDGHLRVTKPAPARAYRRPIDTLFVSLAENHNKCAVGIVLSGVGSDGSLGLGTIKERGGLTMAQAEFDSSPMIGMPHSAVATGLVDFVLPVETMPAKLMELQHHLHSLAEQKDADGTRQDASQQLAAITSVLRQRINHDFSGYKEKSLTRRIQRRMQVQQIESLSAYADFIRQEPQEAEALFKELLIGVTEFFRDPEAFEALKADVIPSLLAAKHGSDSVRVWVPGCSTGEEVFSIAILLKETMQKDRDDPRVTIFGTDIDTSAVAFARGGRYSKVEGLSPERLERWFQKRGEDYCPVPVIREMCVFSVHSLVKDPPFSKLDLISCRNVLIYLGAEFQQRVMQVFHYALNSGGYLFMGPSEGIGRDSKLFKVVDKKHRILQRIDGRQGAPFVYAGPERADERGPPPAARTSANADSIATDVSRLMEKYAPAYFVIDEQYEILRFSGGDTGLYLEPSAGIASLNLFNILRKDLRSDVRAGLQEALGSQKAVIKDDVTVGIDGQRRDLVLIVEPMTAREAGSKLCVIALRPKDGSANTASQPAAETSKSTREALHRKLSALNTQLQAARDEMETYIEESKAATEEYQSVNEELQSSNEELETAKEELQSVNEELQIINAELANKNELALQANSDLENLLDSTQIATIFLDDELRLRNFTPITTDLFPLRRSDRGRVITDFVSNLDYDELRQDAIDVQRKLSVVEREVTLKGGAASYIMRMRPYLTVRNVIDGVVVTFVDVTERKRGEHFAALLRAIVDSSQDAVVSKSLSGVIATWNAGAEQLFGYSAGEAVGKPITMLLPPDRQDEEANIMQQVRRGEHVVPYETVRCGKDGNTIDVSLAVSPIRNSAGKIVGASEIVRDITERKLQADHLVFLMREMSHRTNNLLSVIQSMANQTGRYTTNFKEFTKRFNARLQALAASNRLLVTQDWKGVELDHLVHAQLAPFMGRFPEGLDAAGPLTMLNAEAVQSFGLALHELATNAAKYGALSQPGGEVIVRWEYYDGKAEPCFRLMWQERSGPPVKPPERKGFGRVVLEKMTEQTMGAKVKSDFAPEGVRWTLECPTRRVVQSGRAQTGDLNSHAH